MGRVNFLFAMEFEGKPEGKQACWVGHDFRRRHLSNRTDILKSCPPESPHFVRKGTMKFTNLLQCAMVLWLALLATWDLDFHRTKPSTDVDSGPMGFLGRGRTSCLQRGGRGASLASVAWHSSLFQSTVVVIGRIHMEVGTKPLSNAL